MNIKNIIETLADLIISQNIKTSEIKGKITADSRLVGPGDIFVAVKGPLADGHNYIQQAQNQAPALIIAEKADDIAIDNIIVSNSAEAFGRLAHLQNGRPSDTLKCLGITGTNGKTTIAFLTRYILSQNGMPCGMIGTVNYDLGDNKIIKADNTTPGANDLAKMLAQMLQNKMQAAVMECSSHGLDQRRTAGINFTAGAFTNLTGDHLDYHKTPENYFNAKARLFTELKPSNSAVINIDDPAGLKLIEKTQAKILTYSLCRPATLSAKIEKMDLQGCQVLLKYNQQDYNVNLPLIGRHNVENMLAAIGLALAAGLTIVDIIRTIETFTGVPGRLEKVSIGQNFQVLVDYAHTDDALMHSLETIKSLNPTKLTVIFGCGGDRDQSKRPRMARIAERWADQIIVTNDNPRTEDPDFIISQIRQGFGSNKNVVEIPDRAQAIKFAIDNAQAGQAILIAGKGHEDYQVIGDTTHKFDDRMQALDCLSNRFGI